MQLGFSGFFCSVVFGVLGPTVLLCFSGAEGGRVANSCLRFFIGIVLEALRCIASEISMTYVKICVSS